MRLPAILALAFVVLLAGCGGGDDYTETPAGGGDTPQGQPGTEPDQPQRPKQAAASPEAVEVMKDYKNVDAIQDDAQKKERAIQRAAAYEGRSLPADASFYLGLLYRYAEEWGKASAEFGKFIRGNTDPNDRNLKTGLYYLVTTAVKDGQLDAAALGLTDYVAKYPDEAKYIKAMSSSIAYGNLIAGDFEKAATQYARAVEMDDTYAGEELVRCLWATGKYDEARTRAAALATKFKDHAEEERYTTLNDLAQNMGKPAQALELAGWSLEDGYDIEDLKGKVHLVFFWAVKNRGGANKIWRLTQPIFDKYSGEPFRVIGVSQPSGYNLADGASQDAMTTEDEVQNLKVWAFNFPTPWPLGLATDPALPKAYGYRGKIPANALVGKKGNLRYFRDTSDDESYEILKKVIEKLLDE